MKECGKHTNKMGSVLSTIAEVRKQADSAVVFVSFGKDSLVLLDLLYPRFDRLVCVFMYFVPGLEHIGRYLRYCKARYPKAVWVQIPHWNLTYIRRAGIYCEPEPDVKLKKLGDVIEEVREATGIQWVFLGMKKADSLNRRLMLMQYESSNYTNNFTAYPLAEWTNKEEKELNILLNNPSAQGEWDNEQLARLLPSIDTDVAGLTEADLAFLQPPAIPEDVAGDDMAGFVDLQTLRMDKGQDTDPERYESEKARLSEEKRKTQEKANAEALNNSAYLCLSFSDFAHKREFCQRFGIPSMETYISGEDFGEIIERID